MSDAVRPTPLDPEIARRLKRDEAGLFPAVAQQHDTGEVLMVGWMDDEALHRIFTTGSTMRGQAPIISDERIHPGWRAAGEAGLPICAQITAAAIPDLEKL